MRSLFGPSLAVLAATASLLSLARPAAATTMSECSAKYQTAKKAGTLNGQDWNAYRAANCSATPAAAAAPATAATTAPMVPPAAAPVATQPVATQPAATQPAPTSPAPGKTAVAPAQAGSPVFPDKIDPKYATLKAGTGRMKTCDEQYKANKATGGNAGLKWIQKGGGYYSECSKHLKGA